MTCSHTPRESKINLLMHRYTPARTLSPSSCRYLSLHFSPAYRLYIAGTERSLIPPFRVFWRGNLHVAFDASPDRKIQEVADGYQDNPSTPLHPPSPVPSIQIQLPSKPPPLVFFILPSIPSSFQPLPLTVMLLLGLLQRRKTEGFRT